MAPGRLPAPLDGVDGGDPAGPAEAGALGGHQADRPEAEDGDAVAEPHRAVAHGAEGDVGGVPVHQRLGRDAAGGDAQAAGLDGVGLAHGQVLEDAVAYLQAVHGRAGLDDLAEAHVAQGPGELRGFGLAPPVQAQAAVPAVGGVGRVGAEAAQLGAVLDGAEEAAHAHLAGLQGRLLVGSQEGVSGAVGDQLEGHGRLRGRGGRWAIKIERESGVEIDEGRFFEEGYLIVRRAV